MTAHDDRSRLRHMLDAAEEILAFTHGKKLDDLHQDRLLQLAVVRDLEVIGEAASRISSEFQSQHPEIAWRLMTGMRNRLIHAYFEIDTVQVWATITDDLPLLIAQLQSIVADS